MDLIDLTVACLIAVAQTLLQPFRFPLCKILQNATGYLELLDKAAKKLASRIRCVALQSSRPSRD
jgi:hypothetical protein